MVEDSLRKSERKGRRISSSKGTIVPPFIDDWVRSGLVCLCPLPPHATSSIASSAPTSPSGCPSVRPFIHPSMGPSIGASKCRMTMASPSISSSRVGCVPTACVALAQPSSRRPSSPLAAAIDQPSLPGPCPLGPSQTITPSRPPPASCRRSCSQLHQPSRSRLGRSSDENTPSDHLRPVRRRLA